MKLLSCAFNMDTNCVELKFADGSMIYIDTTAVEDEVAHNMYQRSELDYLIYNDPAADANTAARGAEALAQVADKNGGPTKILAEKLLEEYRALGVPIRSIVFREGSFSTSSIRFISSVMPFFSASGRAACLSATARGSLLV